MVMTYFGIALKMLIVFSLVVYGMPVVYWFFSYMNHVADGNDFDSYDWQKDDYLDALDDFCDVIGARTADDRVGASIMIVALLSVFWIIGIPVVLYFFYVLHAKVKNNRYDKLQEEMDARRKQHYENTEDM